MPTDAVWVIITIPRKEYEKELKKIKNQNFKNNHINDADDAIDARKRQNDSEITFEKILTETLEELRIENVVWVPDRNGNFYQIYFPCNTYEYDAMLIAFQEKGIGSKGDTSIGFIPFNLFFYREGKEDDELDNFNDNFEYALPGDRGGRKLKPGKSPLSGFKEAAKEFLDSITSRLTVNEVVEGVRAGSEINFDFCCYVLMAAFVCSFALIANDAVNIGASMMIEGIMGTVTAMGFAVIIHDSKLFWLGAKNCIISCLMSIFHGWWMGMIIFIWMHEWNPPPDGTWPNPQQQGRGTYWGLIYGVMIAFPCGGAIAVTLLNANSCAAVGVALASTFMPPVVNCGQLWALATHYQIRGLWQPYVPYNISGTIYHLKPAWAPQSTYHNIYSYDMRVEVTLLGLVSIALTALNVVFLWLGCVIVLWIKQIAPLEKMSLNDSRFFKQDLKIYRDYQDKKAKLGIEEPMGRQILREWADITGIDKNQLLDKSPEARITRMQTLYDIARDVEADDTYQHVMRHMQRDNPRNVGLVRRLTQPDMRYILPRDPHDYYGSPPVWSTDHNSGHNYTVNPSFRNHPHDDSPYSTVNSAHGIRPGDLKTERGRRQSSIALRRQLRDSPHSPYSIYPSNQYRSRPENVVIASDLRRRAPNHDHNQNYMGSTRF